MPGPRPLTPEERGARAAERGRRRQLLQDTWVRVEPLLAAEVGDGFRVERHDGRLVLVWPGLVPVRVRPLLDRLGVGDLFALRSEDGWPEDVDDLGDELRAELDRAGVPTHGFRLTADHTGPSARVSERLTAEQETIADRVCAELARRHDVGAAWEPGAEGPGFGFVTRAAG